MFKQLIGTAMGCRPAPDYANIFMATIDKQILDLALQPTFQNLKIKFYKRFLDDIFIIINSTTTKLHDFLNAINNIHPSVKFTMQHTTPYNLECEDCDKCDCEAMNFIPFLDTQCTIKNRKIIVDLYKKKTDRNMYLLTSSCHPAHVTANIPFSLALRIVRICSEQESRDKRLAELKEMLLDRDYKPKIIDAAINKAKGISRQEALKRVVKDKSSDRAVFVVRYDPGLPSITKIVHKHWRSMTSDPHMKAIFPKPPLIAYKRPMNIRDKLIRARVPPPPSNRPTRVKNGMFKCNKPCSICPYVKVQKSVKSTTNTTSVELHKHHTCNDENICYIIECGKCQQQYIGETEFTVRQRFLQHRGYVRREETGQATGNHFSLPGHSMADMTISVLERITTSDPMYRKVRESHWIEQFEARRKGINRRR